MNGKKLLEVRSVMNMSQGDFACRVGVSQGHISKMERGTSPLTDTVWQSARIFLSEYVKMQTMELERRIAVLNTCLNMPHGRIPNFFGMSNRVFRLYLYDDSSTHTLDMNPEKWNDVQKQGAERLLKEYVDFQIEIIREEIEFLNNLEAIK